MKFRGKNVRRELRPHASVERVVHEDSTLHAHKHTA